MTVAELTCGRGTPMSAQELTVVWPAYFRHRERQAEYERQREAARPGGRR